MEWLVPNNNIRHEINLGYDTLYKPYTVEPLVSRFSYGSSISSNSNSNLNGISSLAPRPSNNNRGIARNAALDDIDELTLAVETKNFLGNKAVSIPGYNPVLGNNPFATTTTTVNDSLYTNIYDNPTNALFQTYLNNPINSNFRDQLYTGNNSKNNSFNPNNQIPRQPPSLNQSFRLK